MNPLSLIALAAQLHGVPYPVLRAVCSEESGLSVTAPALCGVHSRRGGYVPLDRQPDAAAHALARWRRVCGSWAGAAQFFHTGSCRLVPCAGHRHGPVYGLAVMRRARRVAAFGVVLLTGEPLVLRLSMGGGW